MHIIIYSVIFYLSFFFSLVLFTEYCIFSILVNFYRFKGFWNLICHFNPMHSLHYTDSQLVFTYTCFMYTVYDHIEIINLKFYIKKCNLDKVTLSVVLYIYLHTPPTVNKNLEYESPSTPYPPPFRPITILSQRLLVY